MEMIKDSIYFSPGNIVCLRLQIPNAPIMLVVRKETSMFKHDDKRILDKKSILLGIRCRWFTTSGEMQEAVFNTKDLQLINQ